MTLLIIRNIHTSAGVLSPTVLTRTIPEVIPKVRVRASTYHYLKSRFQVQDRTVLAELRHYNTYKLLRNYKEVPLDLAVEFESMEKVSEKTIGLSILDLLEHSFLRLKNKIIAKEQESTILDPFASLNSRVSEKLGLHYVFFYSKKIENNEELILLLNKALNYLVVGKDDTEINLLTNFLKNAKEGNLQFIQVPNHKGLLQTNLFVSSDSKKFLGFREAINNLLINKTSSFKSVESIALLLELKAWRHSISLPESFGLFLWKQFNSICSKIVEESTMQEKPYTDEAVRVFRLMGWFSSYLNLSEPIGDYDDPSKLSHTIPNKRLSHGQSDEVFATIGNEKFDCVTKGDFVTAHEDKNTVNASVTVGFKTGDLIVNRDHLLENSSKIITKRGVLTEDFVIEEKNLIKDIFGRSLNALQQTNDRIEKLQNSGKNIDLHIDNVQSNLRFSCCQAETQAIIFAHESGLLKPIAEELGFNNYIFDSVRGVISFSTIPFDGNVEKNTSEIKALNYTVVWTLKDNVDMSSFNDKISSSFLGALDNIIKQKIAPVKYNDPKHIALEHTITPEERKLKSNELKERELESSQLKGKISIEELKKQGQMKKKEDPVAFEKEKLKRKLLKQNEKSNRLRDRKLNDENSEMKNDLINKYKITDFSDLSKSIEAVDKIFTKNGFIGGYSIFLDKLISAASINIKNTEGPRLPSEF